MQTRLPIHNISNCAYDVYFPVGAVEELVCRRELRNSYETNRDMKLWSFWFLLKAISPNSSIIHHWIKNKPFILSFLQCNENTFRRQLKEMVRLKLATVDHRYNITLTSFKKAAAILGITWKGTMKVKYNPKLYEGKQSFRYLLVATEMKCRQEQQLSALMFHLDKNPTLKNDILFHLIQLGVDEKRLQVDPFYFQERLLQLQLKLFREGSEILSYIYTHRADINRGVRRIQKHHAYKSASSVSYLKKCMQKAGVISIKKIPAAVSDTRARLYIPTEAGGQHDGYKWVQKSKKTALFLTDQIFF